MCIYIYIYIYIHAYIHTYIHTYIRIRIIGIILQDLVHLLRGLLVRGAQDPEDRQELHLAEAVL